VEGDEVTEILRQALVIDGCESALGFVGSGESCIYLHSEFGETIDHPALAQLAASGYRVVAPVIPGFRAGPPPEWGEITHAVFWLRCLLDAIDLEEPVTLIGSGLGGWLAAELAVWFPERIEHLVLIGASGLRLEGCAVAELFREGLAPLSSLVLPYGGELENLIPPPDAPDVNSRKLHLLRALEATARLAWAPYFYDPKLLFRLSRISSATTVIWGDDDRVVPLAHGEEYARALGADLTVIQRCGHLPLLEQPDRVIDVIRSGVAVSGGH
jgi:pimeloyl-ACP methyl ester carboxylesterase